MKRNPRRLKPSTPIAASQAIDALAAITATLDGNEYSADTAPEIEAILRGIGCTIRDVVTRRRRPGKMPAVHVWVVIIEWNDRAPSEWVGDPGLIGVYGSLPAAEDAARAERKKLHDDGRTVFNFSMIPGRYKAAGVCDYCGAELKDTGSCDNDHDEWDLDVHVREATIE